MKLLKSEMGNEAQGKAHKGSGVDRLSPMSATADYTGCRGS